MVNKICGNCNQINPFDFPCPCNVFNYRYRVDNGFWSVPMQTGGTGKKKQLSSIGIEIAEMLAKRIFCDDKDNNDYLLEIEFKKLNSDQVIRKFNFKIDVEYKREITVTRDEEDEDDTSVA